MFIKKVEITEENGMSTVKVNDKELCGLTYIEFKKSSTGTAELTLTFNIVSATEKV